MGISPFDRSGTCPTCGLTSIFCPGHHGHLSLVAPIYNPFLIKELYRLLKATCFHCHRLRVNAHKISAFTNALKLIKAGEIVGSQKLKQHFLSCAKDVVSGAGGIGSASNSQDRNLDNKKTQKIRNMWNRITGKDHRSNQGVSDDDMKD